MNFFHHFLKYFQLPVKKGPIVQEVPKFVHLKLRVDCCVMHCPPRKKL